MVRRKIVDIISTGILSAIVMLRFGTFGIGIWGLDMAVINKLFISVVSFTPAIYFTYAAMNIGMFESFGTSESSREDFLRGMRFTSMAMVCIMGIMSIVYFNNNVSQVTNIMCMTLVPCIIASLCINIIYRIMK